ncbi:MAG: DUF4352 domain-containing protein [Chloroflexi bacterium]|nr:DUF4352 domain-containing protein [Chloroflexota bacterium]
MNKNTFYIILAIGALLLASLACGATNEGTVITPSAQEIEKEGAPAEETEAEPVEQESKPAFEIYEVGDLIEIKEHTIRLNSIEYQGSVLVANFTVENHGSSDMSLSSLMSFSAKKDDGTLLEQEYFDCGTSGLDGSVLPGDKLRGDICWKGASPDASIKVYYEASLFGQGAIVWNAISGVAEESASSSEAPAQVEVFHVGDLVQVKSHTIRLNNLEYRGTILFADFTIENQGDSDISMSSMMSFSAKKSDGTLLEQEYFDCGTSDLDGKVLPGDRHRGSTCWAGATPEDGIKLYYEASLFGEGAVVWEAVSGNAEPVDVPDAQLKVNVFRIGDVVQIKDQTITLNSVEFLGNILKANFTLENLGSTDLNVSSMLSFEARKRDGSSLEQEYFDCGTSLDGSVISGDKLRGDICWSEANLGDGIKLYYEAELFSDGAVVWRVE